MNIYVPNGRYSNLSQIHNFMEFLERLQLLRAPLLFHKIDRIDGGPDRLGRRNKNYLNRANITEQLGRLCPHYLAARRYSATRLRPSRRSSRSGRSLL